MTRVLTRDVIEQALTGIDLLPLMEAGFAAYSEGRCNIPPVGELMLEKGEVHIKYGCITGGRYYVVKVASGFYGNPALGLASSNGLMLVFDQATGALETVLLDEGMLTDVRTAVAGAVAARYLAPRHVEHIGVIGTGMQARLQMQYLMPIVPCRKLIACGRTPQHLEAYRRDMEVLGFDVQTTDDPAVVGAHCQLIVTTTPATAETLGEQAGAPAASTRSRTSPGLPTGSAAQPRPSTPEVPESFERLEREPMLPGLIRERG